MEDITKEEIVRVEPSSDDTQSTLVLKYRDGKGPAGFTGEFLVNLHDPSRQLVQHFYDSDEDPNKLKDEGLQKEIRSTVKNHDRNPRFNRVLNRSDQRLFVERCQTDSIHTIGHEILNILRPSICMLV